ncbi:MAG: ral secretion pathway protein [Sphingomonadales bacterium]|jgi:general secretion pathway protein M|nr:ral secretion pathway protein [Sphingomonadales bacterium]
MNARFRALWLARSRRERWLLGLMLALAALVLVWLLVLRPLSDMLSAARQRHGEAVAALAEARSQAAAIEALEKNKPAPFAGPIDSAVAAAASAAGFQLSGLQPEGEGGVSLAIGAARPQALFGWIAALEAQGYIVQSLTATSNPDRTLSARILLRARGG